ncbi:cupin domain-containing protein [Magnetococcus sp. PR-3]|uniref:cupin domain-containing protein n=1 Tax=Magnetococcus sp. PR-3 TaxID=3120355 RepID=UPI002FCE23FB
MTIETFKWPDQATMQHQMQQWGYYPITYHYAPGTYFAPHTHPVDKIVGVVAGTLHIQLQGHTQQLGPMQGVKIPAHMRHDAEVIGQESVVSVDAMAQL